MSERTEVQASGALHPELNLPYGQWIVIAHQRRTGAVWFNKFQFDTMELIERIVKAQHGWILQRRVCDPGWPTPAFERVLWLQTPAFQNWRQNRRR